MKVRMPGINPVRARGRMYYYHRATGKRIHGEPGTPEFLEQVAAIERAARSTPPSTGTLGELFTAYRASPEFTALAARTRADYGKVLDYLKPLDAMPRASIDTAFVLKLRDKAFAKRKRRFANYTVQVLRLIFSWGRPRGLVQDNPAADVPLLRRPRDLPRANRPWTPAERKAVMAHASGGMKIAVALGYYAALREGDVLKFPWSGYDGTAISGIQGKTGAAIWVEAHRDLRTILNKAKKNRCATVMVTNRRGLPYTPSGFRASFFALIRALESKGLVGPGLTFHGLRHTLATDIANAGGDTRDVAAVLQHESEAMAAHYSATADRKKRARNAIRLVEKNTKRTRFCKT